MTSRKLKVGLFIDSYNVDAWFHHAVSSIADSEHCEFTVVLGTPVPIGNSLPSSSGNVLFRWFRAIDHWRFRGYRKPDASEPCDLSPTLNACPRLEVVCAADTLDCTDEDFATIQKLDIDVLIAPSMLMVAPRMLKVARYGLWVHVHNHSDESLQAPPGFWESTNRRPTTGSMLVKVMPGATPNLVLYRSWTMTYFWSPSVNLNYVLWTSASFVPRQLERLNALGETEFLESVEKFNVTDEEPDGIDYDLPGYFRTALLSVRWFVTIVFRYFRQKFYWEQWIILVHMGNDRPPISQFQKIEPPENEFWADPFVVVRDSRYFIFIEILVRETDRGHLAVVEIDSAGKLVSVTDILKTDYHLSYPFMLDVEGVLYMIPETKENGAIDLYECTSFPAEWKFKKTLMEDVRAVDTTIFYHDGLWWMFTTLQDNPGMRSCEDLHIFYAENFDDSQWTAHAANPVVSDTRAARSAGSIYRDGDRIIRPSQDCSISYGHGIRFNEVVELSTSRYEERVIDVIEPTWEKGFLGTHTFSRGDGITVIDGIRTRRIA